MVGCRHVKRSYSFLALSHLAVPWRFLSLFIRLQVNMLSGRRWLHTQQSRSGHKFGENRHSSIGKYVKNVTSLAYYRNQWCHIFERNTFPCTNTTLMWVLFNYTLLRDRNGSLPMRSHDNRMNF